ncbi:hypothetical protein D1610_06560 [Sphingomonas gilva]|uniref:Uncharacterized protein n=1 Tax=Sphingomonas gilva TaxID=2305907 RepID=A0A396RS33_9SPHN|nr:sigma-70 region 4 domain-containing protein [Sphingomonas gilva]RHW18142.1 hypothetical protein D1610_06560 [Sphingomonas gilva]
MNAYTSIAAADGTPTGAEAGEFEYVPLDFADPYPQRHDGWTPDRRRIFLEMIADGIPVAEACRRLGLSESGVYQLRRRAAGQPFALAWQAANLIARDRHAEILLDRALEGYTESVTRADGSIVVRRRYDNRLAHAMLTRLDRMADQAEAKGTLRAAQRIAGEFDAFLDLVERDAGPARAGQFLARRAADDMVDQLDRAERFDRAGAGLAEEVATDDLDPADRAGWTAEQWRRADAAGLLTLAAPAPGEGEGETAPDTEDTELPRDRMLLWQHGERREWRTDMPPPPGFDGLEWGEFGDREYSRELSETEAAIIEAYEAEEREEKRAELIAVYPMVFGIPFPAEPEAEECGETDETVADRGNGGEEEDDAPPEA